jgi:signal transduction histidine kinase/ActR/RegA family two-component response regulator
MYNLYIPFCSLILNIFLIILYLSKISNAKEENKYYFAMIIDTFVMTVMCIFAVYHLYHMDPDIIPAIELSNRIECFAILNFFTNLLAYVLLLTKNKPKNFNIYYWAFNIVIAVFIFNLPLVLEVTSDLNYMVTKGLMVDFTSVVSGLLLIFTFYLASNNKKVVPKNIIPTIFSFIPLAALIVFRIQFIPALQGIENEIFEFIKDVPIYLIVVLVFLVIIYLFAVVSRSEEKMREKLIPMMFLLIFLVMVTVLRAIIPEVIMLEFLATFGNLIMYHTIENPDVKLIEKLNIAKMEAERANELKRDFLSNMSHEIRTPLNAIVGLSASLKEENLPERIKEDINDIVSSSHTLLEIVGNIIDINQIESQKLNLVESSYNINEVIHEVVKMNSFRIKNKDVKVNVEVGENTPEFLKGSLPHIKQILNNLISNAMKYTSEGVINIRTEATFYNELCNLYIIVSDTGSGMTDEEIGKLFNKYERLNIDEVSAVEGTGLGLTITKQLVNAMQGKIKVRSELGKGTTFNIMIPQTIGELQPKEEVEYNFNNFIGKRLLIIDDNKLNVKIATRMFEKFQLKIDVGYNGEECLKLTSENDYDLILLDVMMPNLDGPSTLKILKKDSNFRVPVIAFTADVFSGAKDKYKDLGFDDYLTKPFTEEDAKKLLIRIDKTFNLTNN